MKLLHTSDWHLGARLGRVDRAPDHEQALQGLESLARDVSPDLILHTGDLFDATRPPYEALQLGVRSLAALSRLAPTVVLAGNHDSKALFRVLDEMASAAEPRRLWFVTDPDVWTGAGASVACVPFVPPGVIANYAADDPDRFAGTYADGVRTLNRQLLGEARKVAGSHGVVLYAAHLHVHGARPGKSERRLTVGDDYATHPTGLEKALYCAFGHIHDPQLVPGGVARGRYAGSLIPLDYGEVEQTKQAVVVRIGHEATVEPRELAGGRPLVHFTGDYAEFESRAAGGGFNDCILKARVTSDEPIPDLADRLRDWSPGCAVFELTDSGSDRAVRAVDDAAAEEMEPSMEELFRTWRETRATGKKAGHDAVATLFGEAIADGDLGATGMHTRADEVLAALKGDG